MFCHKRYYNLTISIHGDPSCHKQFCYLPISIHGDPSELRPEKTSTGILCHTLLLSIGVAKTPKKLFYNPKLQQSSIIQVCICKRIQLFRVLVSGDVKKKNYFISSNTILSILPTYLTTYSTYQFLLLHTI